jgi:hypothetical protein
MSWLIPTANYNPHCFSQPGHAEQRTGLFYIRRLLDQELISERCNLEVF